MQKHTARRHKKGLRRTLGARRHRATEETTQKKPDLEQNLASPEVATGRTETPFDVIEVFGAGPEGTQRTLGVVEIYLDGEEEDAGEAEEAEFWAEE